MVQAFFTSHHISISTSILPSSNYIFLPIDNIIHSPNHPNQLHPNTQHTMATTTAPRSIYRRLLRELPSRTPSILANPSPIQRNIREDIASTTPTSPSQHKIAEAEQFIQYLKAQRMYLTLIERYNPGMNLEEEERIRLTGRRVGMEMPEEFVVGGGKK